MIEYVRDDGGRKDAGFARPCGDCFVRSISILTGIPYRKVWRRTAREFKRHCYPETGDGNVLDQYRKFLFSLGYPAPRDIQDALMPVFGLHRIPMGRNGPRPTFTEAFEAFGDCIVDTKDHQAALADGRYRDTWNWKDEYWDGSPRPSEIKALGVWVQR